MLTAQRTASYNNDVQNLEDSAMLGDGGLAFAEFVMQEPLPLATVHRGSWSFCGTRRMWSCSAQAVNAYVDEPRMTQDVDVASTRAAEIADKLRDHLNRQFHIAVRVREVSEGRGYRLYQIQKPKNRHLADVARSLSCLRRVALVASWWSCRRN